MKKKYSELAKAAYRDVERSSASETHPPRMLRKGNALHTRRRGYTHGTVPSRVTGKCHVDFPIWKRPPGREKRARRGARIPGPAFQLAAAVDDGPCPLDPTGLSTPQGGQKFQPLSFHHSDGPKARMALTSGSRIRCSPRGGFHFPRISLSTYSGRLLEHRPLSTFPALSWGQL